MKGMDYGKGNPRGKGRAQTTENKRSSVAQKHLAATHQNTSEQGSGANGPFLGQTGSQCPPA